MFFPAYVPYHDLFLQRAIEEGADFIETDILSSKDGVLISFHDFILDNTTDIADHKEFANRKRTYDVQGVNTTGFFTGNSYPFCLWLYAVTVLAYESAPSSN